METQANAHEMCCLYPDQVATDDGNVIYPDMCHCVCHTPED